MSFARPTQNSSHVLPIHPIVAHGLVGNALENDVPVSRPIVIALVISVLIFLAFLACFLWALFSKKGVVKSKLAPILDLEEHSLKNNDHVQSLQSAFIKSCFDTYPRRSGLSSPGLGYSEYLFDTPTPTTTRFRFSSHLGSPQDNVTLPPPAYSSRAQSLVSRKPPSLFFLDFPPPSPASTKRERRSLFAIAKEKQPPLPPPPIISRPIPLPEPPLPGPPIEYEYALKPLIYLKPELTPMSSLQVPVVSKPDAGASRVSLISQTKPGIGHEHNIPPNTSDCRCGCHEPPLPCSSCRPPRPRPIYIPASPAVSFLKCPTQDSSDASSLTSSQIGLAF